MVRVFLVLLMTVCAATASAQVVEPGDLRLELSFEERSGPLYTGEMVLLKVRGFYKIRIAREHLKQSGLDGFDWMQLGEDTWTKDTSQGGEILQFERTLALFPNRAGTIEIAPFTHELELWTRTGERYDNTLTSAPIAIEVTERPETDGWWLPARRLMIDDEWSNAPDQLGTGEGALRVVTLTVEGVTPEQVPPMPQLGSAGAFVFAHPEMRITRLYRRGPVTRVVWRWTVRPENPPSAYLEPIRIPYFDTRARKHREIVIAAQRIAMTEEAVAAYLAEADTESVAAMEKATADAMSSDPASYLAGIVAPAGLLGGLLGGLAVMMPGMHRRRLIRKGVLHLRRDPDIRVLKHAAARGDTAAARAAAVRLIDRGNGDIPRMKEALVAFDRPIFGSQKAVCDPEALAKSTLKARRSGA